LVFIVVLLNVGYFLALESAFDPVEQSYEFVTPKVDNQRVE
jgi:hypothetical protein